MCFKGTKVSIIGAGNVGTAAANFIATQQIANEIVLIDIEPGLAEGKAMDIMQSSYLIDFDAKVRGVTNEYVETADSDVIVITSGISRKQGMKSDQLLGANAETLKEVLENSIKYSPNAIYIIAINPIDSLTYLAVKLSGLQRNRVIGLGGILDSERFKYFLSIALGCNQNDVNGIVLGGHNENRMIPLTRFASYKGIPVSSLLSKEQLNEVVNSTVTCGDNLNQLLGTSAWIAPGASIAYLVKSIIRDERKLIPCSIYLRGEYRLFDISIGVPTIIGKNGAEKIIELEFNKEEEALFRASVEGLRDSEYTFYVLGFL